MELFKQNRTVCNVTTDGLFPIEVVIFEWERRAKGLTPETNK